MKDKEKRIKKISEKKAKKKEKKEGRPPGRVRKLLERIERIAGNRFFGNMAIQAALIASCLLLFIEAWEYKSFWGGWMFLIDNPLAFLLNALVIFATLTPAWFFKRRIFVYTLISLVWSVIGLANGIILTYRMTPFTTADLEIIDMGLDLLPNYLSTPQIIMLSGAFMTLAIGYVLLFIFGPKRKERPGLKKTVACVLLSAVLLTGSWNLGVKSGVVAVYFENLWDAYHDFGVPYCFLSTWLSKGISKPADYSKATIQKYAPSDTGKTMSSENGKTEKDFPNLIFLQMESFIDPEEVKGLSFSSTPAPFFKELKEKYSSGYLTVPVVGGGTANTEFESMSGMSMKFFGPGEYPYKSILRKTTCETMAYLMKRLGYGSHVIHNHRGAFYNRNTVFANLGFDDFTSLEYMNYVSKTPKNFATDDVLRGEIIGALESTKTKDYIYTISVQGHGEYPRRKSIEDPAITVSGTKTEELKYGYEYYLQQVSEMDTFLKELTQELSEFGEDVALVIYGDHLPALDIENDDTKSGSTFDTQYVIWTNFKMKKEDKDLSSWQLAAEVQSRIGMREGTLMAYHQDNRDRKDYREGLHALQYDMLYGNRYVYGGKTPFKPTDLQMGYRPIRINEIVLVAGQYYISGEGFTPFSKVSLEGKILDTIYMGPTVIKLMEEVDPSEVSRLKVSQVEKYNSVLSTTE